MEKKKQLLLINYYRGFAALSVLIYHLSLEIGSRFNYPYFFNIFRPFSFGVDFFFVLSGFILFYIHKKDISKRGTLGKFFKKRFIRIFPVYWTLVSLALISFIVTKTNITHTLYMSPLFILRSYLLFPVAAPILPPAWTLSYEIFFYVVFALFIFFRQTKLLLFLLAGYLLLILPLNFLAPDIIATHLYGGWLQVILRYFIGEFMLGVGSAYCLFNFRKLSVTTYQLLIYISLLLLLGAWGIEILIPTLQMQYRFFTFALPAALLLFASARYEHQEKVVQSNLLNFFGNASYSIYLMQAFLILIYFKIIYLLRHDWPTVFLFPIIIAGFVFCISIAGVFHLFVEKPLLRSLKR